MALAAGKSEDAEDFFKVPSMCCSRQFDAW